MQPEGISFAGMETCAFKQSSYIDFSFISFRKILRVNRQSVKVYFRCQVQLTLYKETDMVQSLVGYHVFDLIKCAHKQIYKLILSGTIDLHVYLDTNMVRSTSTACQQNDLLRLEPGWSICLQVGHIPRKTCSFSIPSVLGGFER